MKVKRREVNCEYSLKQTLDKMYELSKERNEPFYDLIELMTNEQTILTAIHNIKSNKGSKTKGIDKRDINYYLQIPYEKLVQLIRKNIKRYNPLAVRRKHIPKGNTGKTRPLGIPTMLDRIIQEIARIVLEPIAEAKFYNYSFGFRPYRSASQAIAEILERIRKNKTYYVIEGDIKGYFDNINHNKLIEMLWNMGVKDKRFLMIIKKMLKAGVLEEDGKLYDNDVGTPQGGIISPLLANIYLNYFDWMIAKEFQEHPAKYKVSNPKGHGLRRVRNRHLDCFLIRYADDWIILCKTKEQAKNMLKKVEKYFKHKLKLELSMEKTLITDIREKRAKFLGFEIFAEKQRFKDNVLGKCIPNMEKLRDKVRDILKEIRHIRGIHDNHDNATQLELINSKIIGISEYYKISNCSHIYKSQDQKVYNQALKTWYRLNGKKGSWEDFVKPACEVHNRPNRHEKRKDRIFYLTVDGVDIGLTKFGFTKSVNAMKVHSELTPYTDKGRMLYMKSTGKKPLMNRQTLYSEQTLIYRNKQHRQGTLDRKYNFEYMMNREYAFNRDYGKCKCCEETLKYNNIHCHHIRPFLPLKLINKVSNLATVCNKCHELIHGKSEVLGKKKMVNKILKYRNLLVKNKTENTAENLV